MSIRRFRWLGENGGRTDLVYNQEGKHQTLAKPGDIVITALIPDETLERYYRIGAAVRA